MIDGEEQDYSINTQAVSFDDSDESKIYVGASLGINYQLSDAAMLHAKIEAYDSDEDIQLFAARLRFDLKF